MYNIILNAQELNMIRQAVLRARCDVGETTESRVRWQALYDEIIDQMADQKPEE